MSQDQNAEQRRFAELFPSLHEPGAFLNHAAVGPMTKPCSEMISWFIEYSTRKSFVGSGCYKKVDQVREKAAKLIGARGAHEIAFVPNTTTGLANVANGLGLAEGDAVVITDVEFPANRYPWENLARTKGVKLIEVKQRDDARIHVKDVVAAIEPGVKVVAISHVQYASGHRLDLKAVSKAAHDREAFLCVDAIQSVGVVPIDVQSMGVDFLSADSHKWMLGPEGAGIFYAREDLIEKVYPSVAGWINMVDFENYGRYRFEFAKTARRFEPGTWNVVGLLGMGASLDVFLEVGAKRIWELIERNTAQAEQGIRSKGYRIYSPREVESERSGIVIFEYPDDPSKHEQISDQLLAQGVVIAVREGRMRLSPHFYNTPEQIELFVESLPAV